MGGMAWRQPPLTQEEEDELFLLLLENDEEDSPWMVMGDLQFWSASGFAQSLRAYAHRQGLPWYVASMLPIDYRVPGTGHRGRLAPDTLVAFVPERARTSFDVAAEGGFPPFVLEVVSPSSVGRDEREKRRAYNLLGAREYALFTPREGRASTLAGWRRGARGRFESWRPDEQGRLWSEVLGLYLVVQGALLQAQTPDGALLPTQEQAEEGWRRAEEGRRRAEEGWRRAEEEIAALRRALGRAGEQDDRAE